MTHEELRSIQKIQYRILCDTDDFLRLHGISYYLVYGTLLGAVRHQAVIPWDYDIDIAMTRDEFRKLQDVSKNFPERYKIGYVCYSTIDYAGLVRISAENSPPHSTIDIFIIDNAKRSLCKPQRSLCRFLHIAKLSDEERGFIFRRFRNNRAKTFIVRLAEAYNRARGSAKTEKRIFHMTVSGKKTGKFLMLEDIQHIFDSHLIEATVDLRFGDRLFPAPSGYTELLTMWYGDYMKIPPEGIEYLKEEEAENTLAMSRSPK